MKKLQAPDLAGKGSVIRKKDIHEYIEEKKKEEKDKVMEDIFGEI